MCTLCDLNYMSAIDGSHELLSVLEDGSAYLPPVEAVEPDGDLDFGLSTVDYLAASDLSSAQNIDGLLAGLAWPDVELTYSFPDSVSDFSYGQTSHTGLTEFTQQQKNAAIAWLDMVAGVSGLTFTELDGADGALDSDQEAQLKFTNSPAPSTAYAYYPIAHPAGGDMFFNGAGDNPSVGNYDWVVIGHELGHALGLKHGHETSGFGAMNADRDSLEFSIMTYRSYVGSDARYYYNAYDGFPSTLMMYDIAALQHLYGANFQTNSSSTTYSLRTNSSGVVTGEFVIDGAGQGDPVGNTIFLTVWDGNGSDDHYDFSALDTNMDIDLAPGSWSDLEVGGNEHRANLGNGNYARGHVFNALQYNGDARSLIENASAGGGNDRLSGNAADNDLFGGAGNDTMIGLAGNDAFYGGDDTDTVEYLFDLSLYSVYWGADFLTIVGEGVDQVWNDVETLVFNGVSYDFDFLSATVSPNPLVNDLVSVSKDAVALFNVFADNGNGVDGGTSLSLLSIDGATGGSLVLASGAEVVFSADGSVEYRAQGAWDHLGAEETATETFEYVALVDGAVERDATVTVTIDDANDPVAAFDVAATAVADGGSVIISADYQDDDTNDQHTITIDTTGTIGQVSHDGSGGFTYTAGDEFGKLIEGSVQTDSFSYTVDDGNGGTSTASVYVSVQGIAQYGINQTFDESDNTVFGSDSNDVLLGEAGNDVIYAGGGVDVVGGGGDYDLIYGGDGYDNLIGNGRSDTLYGGNGNDRLNGGQGSDFLYGGEDNDTLVGEQGIDRLSGDGGDDLIFGGTERDILLGGAGDDTLDGGEGGDSFTGGAGNDVFIIDGGPDRESVYDFVSGEDVMDLTSTGLSYEDLSILYWETQTIVRATDLEISIRNPQDELLDESDFLFG